MRWRCVAALVAVLALGGCGTPAPMQAHPIVTTDRFSNDVTILGRPMIATSPEGIVHEWRLRSWVAKDTHAVMDQLYVDLYYYALLRKWKNFNRAADEDAHDLTVVRVDRDRDHGCRDDCNFYETLGVMLDDATLRAHAATGYAVKVWAHSGDALVLTITPRMIAEQVAVIDRYAHPVATPKAVGQQGRAN